MATKSISELADFLSANSDNIRAGEAAFNAVEFYAAIDSLGVLAQPVQSYLTQTEDHYYESESDHLLTLQGGSAPLSTLTDRIIVTHTDGALHDGDLNFNYAHENTDRPRKMGETGKALQRLLPSGIGKLIPRSMKTRLKTRLEAAPIEVAYAPEQAQAIDAYFAKPNAAFAQTTGLILEGKGYPLP